MAAEQSTSPVNEAACCTDAAAGVLREYGEAHGDRAFSALARLLSATSEELFKLGEAQPQDAEQIAQAAERLLDAQDLMLCDVGDTHARAMLAAEYLVRAALRELDRVAAQPEPAV